MLYDVSCLKKKTKNKNKTTQRPVLQLNPKEEKRKKKKEKELSSAHLCLVAKKVKVKYEQFCPNLFCPFSLPIWDDSVLVGLERKLVSSTKISPTFYPHVNQTTTKKKKFHPIFLFFIFDPPYNHSNQTKLETHIGTPQSY